MITIGIIGYGVVGKAVGQLAIKDYIRVVPHDLYIEAYATPQNMLAAYNADFVFVCVPTPSDEDGRLNVDLVVDAAQKWTDVCANDNSVLVIKSTVPPGCVEELSDLFETDRIVFNPEFLSQRSAQQDFLEMDDIIIGGVKSATYKVRDLYKLWDREHPKRRQYLNRPHGGEVGAPIPYIRYTLTESYMAELTKMARNSFYATKVTFFNELSDLCEQMDINYADFRQVVAYEGDQSWINPQHTRVPGPDGQKGFGGACLPKDSSGLVALAAQYGVNLNVLDAAIKSNSQRRKSDDGSNSD